MFKKIVLGLTLVASLFASVESEVDAERFSHKNGVLTDSFAGMQWQDNKDAKTIQKNWQGAKDYCSKLTLGGKSDWRLPNIEELEYAYEIKNKFNNITSSFYWSSSPFASYSGSAAWSVNFNDGYSRNIRQAPSRSVRCARAGQYDTLTLLKKKVKQARDNLISKKYLTSYDKAKKLNTIDSYRKFIKQNPRASQVKNVKVNINKLILSNYKNINQENKILSYELFIKRYPKASQVKDAIKNIYKLAYKKEEEINTIESYHKFIQKYPKAPQVKDSIQSIYNLTNKQNNISGYEWFIKKYPKAPQVKDAIKNIHKLAYQKAKEINTISSYNTFVYAYPFALQVRDANDKAYEIESKKYTDIGLISGFFQKEATMEKKARGLLVRAKQIERISHDYSGNAQAGYIIVANRMYQLLQDKFIDSEATLDYMNSLDFKDFTTTFKKAMKDIKYILNQISNNTSDISRYAQESISISKQGFADSKADREMAKYKNEEHIKWEKYMKYREKGYN